VRQSFHRGKSEVWTVAEDRVAGTGKAHEAGGVRWQLAGWFLDHRQRADGVVLAGDDQHGAADGTEHAPGVEALDLAL
jgi:hypothetical protein